ncbi:hypothetical protein LSAT2_023636 [Lamellibrachia satsuma]|nr:hypothetical protein LSAT2_023636 [Lamellibrachia satsuma]
MFSIRIVTTDHYQAAPLQGLDVCHSDFGHCDVSKVPVIRVFGATPTGQKTCMHVHGVFPYLYVPYDGTQPVDRYMRQFACSVDKALNVALGRASSNQQHVFKVTLVSGMPFYGYHTAEQTFLKIYLYNPSMVKRLADLLLGGAVLNKVFQPYEAHIPYLLQMFIDYNLHGMNMLHVAALKFRQCAEKGSGHWVQSGHPARHVSLSNNDTLMLDSVDDDDDNNGTLQVWNMEDIPQELLVDREVAARQSSCQLEVDVVAADIINRLEIGDTMGTNPGLKALWDDEQQRRRERGEPEEIEIPNSPDRENVSWTRGEAALQERLQQIIYDLQPYICSDDDTDSNVSSGSEDVPVIPSSQVICHTSSAEPNDYSQDTILLEGEDREEGAEEEEGEEPVISEESNSNLRVVSSSQSFQQERPEALDSQDRSLAQLLASLARDSPACSQCVLEEQDSILSQLLPPGNETESGEEDVESQEMSQCIQQDDLPDLGGMEYSWNSSQWVDVDSPSKGQGENDGRDINESVIPQLDGPVDEKSDTGAIEQPCKRLGMRGSTISSRRCVRASSHATSPFSFVANTASGMHSSFKASHEVEPFPPPCPPSKKWPSVVVDLRSPPPVQISGNCEMENRIAMKHKKKRECGLKQSVGADMDTTSELCEDKCTEEHRPTLVITFKQVPTALTDQESVKHRLRHAKTWTSTIKTTDVFTRLNDTSEKGVGGRKRCEVGKNARTQSNACEHTATKCRGRIHSGDMQQDTCGKDKMRTPTKMRSFSESTVHSRHDNIFQQMKTDFPGPTEPVLTRSSGGDNSHEGLNSEMDSSGDLFDSDQEMTSEEHVDNDRGINNVHVPDVSQKCLCDDANITDVQLKPTNGVCLTRAASDNVPLNLGEHIRTYRSGQKSFPPRSPERQFDELVKNKPVTESQKSLLPLDGTGAAATVDKTAGSVMPRLMSPCPASPGGEKSHTGTLPHLVSQSSNSAPDLSPTEMPVLIDESQSNDLDSLDLFGQWRPRSEKVLSASGGKHPVLTTVSRGGCRVKLPSDHNKGVVISDTARNDELPRLGCQVKLASNNDAGTQISDRTRKGCRVKLPRKASESDRPLSDGVKSTVRMLLPRSACSPQPHNLRSTLPQMNTGSNASYNSDPTATQHTWPVSLADRKLKLSLRKRKRQQEWEVDGSIIQKRENSGTKVITASHFALDDKEKLTLTKSRHTCSNDWHLRVKSTIKRKSPQKKPKSTEADAAWIPKQSIACKDLFDDAKRRKSRLRLPRKSISDGSVRTRDMVAFSAVLPVANYVGGRRLTDVQLVNSQVWVMRSSFKEYDLEKVGNEMLLLQCLKGDDIAELKLQIQQEELHRKKEKRSASTIGVSVHVEHVSHLFDTSAESESELLQHVRIGTEQNTSTGLDASFPSEIEKVDNDVGVGSALQSKTDDSSSGNGSAAALETEMQDKEEAPVASELTIGNHCKMVVEPKIQHDVKMPSECETENRGIAATEDNMADDEIAPLLSNETEIHGGSHVCDVQSNTKTMKDTMEEHRRCAVAENKGDHSDESETKPVTDDTKAVSERYDTNDNSPMCMILRQQLQQEQMLGETLGSQTANVLRQNTSKTVM